MTIIKKDGYVMMNNGIYNKFYNAYDTSSKENKKLKDALQSEINARKEADNKIIELEKEIKKLKMQTRHIPAMQKSIDLYKNELEKERMNECLKKDYYQNKENQMDPPPHNLGTKNYGHHLKEKKEREMDPPPDNLGNKKRKRTRPNPPAHPTDISNDDDLKIKNDKIREGYEIWRATEGYGNSQFNYITQRMHELIVIMKTSLIIVCLLDL